MKSERRQPYRLLSIMTNHNSSYLLEQFKLSVNFAESPIVCEMRLEVSRHCLHS